MESLELRHFRCFEHFSIDFTPGVNLIVGDNASGKTSLLKGAKYALSSFFSGFSDINTVWLSPSSADFRKVLNNGWEQQPEPIEIEFRLSNPDLRDERLTVRKNSPKNSRNLVNGLLPLRDYGREMLQSLHVEGERRCALPLFDSISTIYTHTGKKIPYKRFLSPSPRATLGYLGALTGGGFGSHWWKRIKVLAETRTRPWELEGIMTAIRLALGPDGCGILSDIQPVVSLNEIFIHYTDGETATYDILPDGYLRLIDITVNIAFRALMLNGEIFGSQAPQETEGVVLIDELDLHLHPSLQATVVRGLRNAFPRIQFIASTHSPLVMSGVENNERDQVILLKNHNGHIVANRLPSYGRDVNGILGLLDLRTRDRETDEELSRLFDLIDDGRNEEAATLLDRLENRFGNRLPDLTEARTLLQINEL